jgi:endophilin-B
VSLRKADNTRGWTERIVSNTEAILQPNPSMRINTALECLEKLVSMGFTVLDERIEDYLLTKLDKKPMKPNNLEILGFCLKDSGQDIGSNTQYGMCDSPDPSLAQSRNKRLI